MPQSTNRSMDDITDDFLLFVHEEVLGCCPDDEEALIYLAGAYTRRGRHEDGLALDRRLVALRPEDPIARYNLACSLALTFRADAAITELGTAIRLGYDDLAHMESDADLEYIRTNPGYAELLRSVEPGS